MKDVNFNTGFPKLVMFFLLQVWTSQNWHKISELSHYVSLFLTTWHFENCKYLHEKKTVHWHQQFDTRKLIFICELFKVLHYCWNGHMWYLQVTVICPVLNDSDIFTVSLDVLKITCSLQVYPLGY